MAFPKPSDISCFLLNIHGFTFAGDRFEPFPAGDNAPKGGFQN
jgi:hypothetical protein